MEPHWNPMAEAQAVDRIHRIGQTKAVKVTKYCVQNSIEEVGFPLFLCMPSRIRLAALSSILPLAVYVEINIFL